MPSDAVSADPLRQVFFGDLHIHSSYSFDAYTMGVRAYPKDAYVYARGGKILHGVGYPVQIDRPLDFAAVSDHAEYLGIARRKAELEEPAKATESHDTALRAALQGYAYEYLWRFMREGMRSSSGEARARNFGVPELAGASRDAWEDIARAASEHNVPGSFSTFIAYEWSSMPEDQHLHRVVLYGDEKVLAMPWSSLESENPEDLWRELERQRGSGHSVIAIPHNSNLSNGLMFSDRKYDGTPLSRELAELRSRIEPVSEIFQVKGQSETHPDLSPSDEFADFELVEQPVMADAPQREVKGSYVRDALRLGMELQHAQGFNPYRFGVIGSTDSHNATSPANEADYHGKLPLLDGTPGLRLGAYSPQVHERTTMHRWSAMGLAAVWAQENTRASLFAAILRKETYATSGSRLRLRFFAGWDYPEGMAQSARAIDVAYAQGVPMGGVLNGGTGQSPDFFIWAAKDPEGANLDRVQVIKGWVDSSGNSHEKVYDVAASGLRERDASGGRLAAVGNTVDVVRGRYTNSIGDAELRTIWRDPDYRPEQQAFYYARALEIPTPRWSTYDAVKLGMPVPDPAWIQERAVSSAIWIKSLQ
ncbi:DUF3604 domain-containing protein [Halioglobus maricola]|uniref:DUF3604 domain-containing protein n=2 Tax=Halioglobus maricola TaxID=2601894 RepID=A0A5P9NPP1_9GAMM|nr:DUF3604 domain-containing protein [Halioglobus maricola]